MKRNEVRRYQKAQIAILDYVVEICKKINVTYYLSFGTLLGAVRHKGFIPWDPDTDIVMFRKDYEQFCEYCEEHNADGRIFIDHYRTDKNHVSSHAIIRIPDTHVIHRDNVKRRYVSKNDGIYIDVFPLDNVPDNLDEENKQIEDIKYVERIMTLKQAPKYKGKTSILKSIMKNAISVMLVFVTMNFLNKKRDSVMRRYENVKTKRVAVFVDPAKYDHKTLQFPVEWFEKSTLVEFEGKKYNAPIGFRAFLEKRYGDYMKLPPEDERWNFLDEALDVIDYGPYHNEIKL